jgi:hypothetical protein
MMAANVEKLVAIRVGAMTFAGSCDPAAARKAITVMGMMVREEVVRATNVHMASVAVPGSWFSSSSFSIALIPKGVAALPIPKMFAEMLRMMAPIAP